MVDKEDTEINIDKGVYYPHDVNRSTVGHQQSEDPQERLKKFPRSDWESFVRGMNVVYEAIFTQERPDAILAPMRGAAPIIWTLEVMSEQNGDTMPIIVKLPVGTNSNLYNWTKLQGVKGREKISILDSYLDTLHSVHIADIKRGGRGVRKIVLLDEAKTGGTITQHASHLYEIQQNWAEKGWDFEISTLMLHDSRNPSVTLDHAVPHLMSNRMGKAQKIALSMPFMDVREILPVILRQEPDIRLSREGHDFKSSELLEVWEGPNVKQAFQNKLRSVIQKVGNSV